MTVADLGIPPTPGVVAGPSLGRVLETLDQAHVSHVTFCDKDGTYVVEIGGLALLRLLDSPSGQTEGLSALRPYAEWAAPCEADVRIRSVSGSRTRIGVEIVGPEPEWKPEPPPRRVRPLVVVLAGPWDDDRTASAIPEVVRRGHVSGLVAAFDTWGGESRTWRHGVPGGWQPEGEELGDGLFVDGGRGSWVGLAIAEARRAGAVLLRDAEPDAYWRWDLIVPRLVEALSAHAPLRLLAPPSHTGVIPVEEWRATWDGFMRDLRNGASPELARE